MVICSVLNHIQQCSASTWLNILKPRAPFIVPGWDWALAQSLNIHFCPHHGGRERVCGLPLAHRNPAQRALAHHSHPVTHCSLHPKGVHIDCVHFIALWYAMNYMELYCTEEESYTAVLKMRAVWVEAWGNQPHLGDWRQTVLSLHPDICTYLNLG